MLSKWIYSGVIEDNYGEFLVQEKKEVSKENINKDFNDHYWDERFSIRSE